MHQRTGDAHALLLAARQLGRIDVRLVREADQFKQLRDASGDGIARHARHAQGQGHVLEHGLGREQVEVLKDHADATAQRDQAVFIQGADIGTVDADLPGIGALEHVDRA